VSERATRLRAAGARALARFLDAQLGRTAAILVERGGLGHTENFAPVHMPDAVPGTIVRTTLTARRDDRLEAA
jgi:threonylcarbamoyladenosine tRNA methylthiotransferase MtaB